MAASLSVPVLAEDGYDLWLRYRTPDTSGIPAANATRELVVSEASPTLSAAGRELATGLGGLAGAPVHAVLGGWHFPWPDGDWGELVERPLLAWTFEDSEPWVEVWGDGKGFQVKQRIT